jgi:hypothetical protein
VGMQEKTMKIGLWDYGKGGFYPGKNTLLEPHNKWRDERGSNSSYHLLNMWPEEIYAILEVDNPDIEICKQLDVVFQIMSYGTVKSFIELRPLIPCKVFVHLHDGIEYLLCGSRDSLVDFKQALDLADAILITDQRMLDAVQLYTTTPVFYYRHNHDIEYIDKVIKESTYNEFYDIVLPYGLIDSDRTHYRNTYFTTLAANEIIKQIPYFNNIVSLRNWVDEGTYKWVEKFKISNITIKPDLEVINYLGIIKNTKVMIYLDRVMTVGRVLLDAAIAKKPVITSDCIPIAHEIYGDMITHDPLDVNAMLNTARLIADGGWKQEWLDLAYERAWSHSLKNSAKDFEDILKEVS